MLCGDYKVLYPYNLMFYLEVCLKRLQSECFEGDGGGHDFGCGNASGKC